MTLSTGGAQVILLLSAVLLGGGMLWVAVLAVWDWRQSKVDLVALEEKIQERRRRDPRFEVRGLTEAELEGLRTSRSFGRLGGRFGPGRRL